MHAHSYPRYNFSPELTGIDKYSGEMAENAELSIAAQPLTDYNDGTAITLGADMAALTIRNIDDEVKNRLRLQAAQHGCSMEQEVREILSRAVLPKQNQPAFAQRIQKHFASLEVDALPTPERKTARTPPSMAR